MPILLGTMTMLLQRLRLRIVIDSWMLNRLRAMINLLTTVHFVGPDMLLTPLRLCSVCVIFISIRVIRRWVHLRRPRRTGIGPAGRREAIVAITMVPIAIVWCVAPVIHIELKLCVVVIVVVAA